MHTDIATYYTGEPQQKYRIGTVSKKDYRGWGWHKHVFMFFFFFFGGGGGGDPNPRPLLLQI